MGKIMGKHMLLASAALTVVLLGAQASQAQQAAPKPAGSGATELETITVTASKRNTSESKTPISMETYTTAAVVSKGITDIQSLAAQDPSLNFASGNGEGYLTLRGVASQNTTETGDPAVPVSTDGFFLNRPYTFNNTLYDVSRIEVLRGPQGTLYGRNAVGGVVNVITNDPTSQYGGYGDLTLGDYGQVDATGALNLPINDRVQIRAAFSSLYHNGYRDNFEAGHGDDQDSRSGRIKLKIEPVDHLKILLTGEFTHVRGTGPVDQSVAFQPGVGGDISHDVRPPGNGRAFPLPFENSLKIDDKAFRWNFSYDDLPGRVTVTYLGGYDDLDWHHVLPSSVGIQQAFVQNEHVKTQNHELRFSSASDQRLVWQVGAFYFDETNPDLFTHVVNNYGGSNPFDFAVFDFSATDDSKAVFGQATYKLTDELSITGGARYTRDHKTEVGVFSLPVFHVVVPEDLEGSWKKITWHAGVDWNPTDRNLVYAKVDKGYKSGGFTGNGAYEPEEIISYEIGTKNRLLDNRVSLNLDAFYEDYTNQQVSVVAPLTSGAGTGVRIQNAGQSEIYGIEFQTQAIVAPLGRFDLSATWQHAHFVDFLAANGAGTANFQLAGRSLPQSPEWAVSAGFEHSWDAPGGSVTARIETKYQSAQYFTYFNYADSRQGAYTMSDAFLRYDNDDGRWQAELFVRNLENAKVFADFQEVYSTNLYAWGYQPPRTFGVRLRLNFGE